MKAFKDTVKTVKNKHWMFINNYAPSIIFVPSIIGFSTAIGTGNDNLIIAGPAISGIIICPQYVALGAATYYSSRYISGGPRY